MTAGYMYQCLAYGHDLIIIDMVTSRLKRFSNQVGFLTKPTLTETRDETVLIVAAFASVSVFWVLKNILWVVVDRTYALTAMEKLIVL